MCEEPVLDEVYVFIKNLLETEFIEIYHTIHEHNELEDNDNDKNKNKLKKIKARKKIIIVDSM